MGGSEAWKEGDGKTGDAEMEKNCVEVTGCVHRSVPSLCPTPVPTAGWTGGGREFGISHPTSLLGCSSTCRQTALCVIMVARTEALHGPQHELSLTGAASTERAVLPAEGVDIEPFVQ